MQGDISITADRNRGSVGPVDVAPKSSDMEDFIYLISHDVRSSVRALLELPQWIARDQHTTGHSQMDEECFPRRQVGKDVL